MTPTRRFFLSLGIIAAVIQLAFAPQEVHGHTMGGLCGDLTLIRRFPIWTEPAKMIDARPSEVVNDDDVTCRSLFIESHKVASIALAMQLGATALLVGLLLLLIR